jgi:hypothetical protein
VETENKYRVLMDERWELEDLYNFPYAYSQTYSFIYCFDSPLDPKSAKRIDIALENYPWRGGYSYTNIYTVLHNQVLPADQPKIASIKYASPGWMDILLNPQVAMKIAASVGTLIGLGVTAVEAYKRIDKARLEIAGNRKKAQMEFAAFSANETKFLNEMSEEIAKNLGFKSLQSLHIRTKSPEVTLKVLMAHHRRISKLAEFVKSGKVQLPINPDK